MARKHSDLAKESLGEGLSELGFIQIDYVLDHIVTEGVLNKTQSVLGDLGDEPRFLAASSMIYAPL